MPKCRLAECPVAIDGRCLEGLGDECPNLIAEVEPSAPKPPKPSSPRQKPRAVEQLYSGQPIDIAEAREFSRASRAVVVSIVGVRECGKTSMLARLHQMFQTGTVADLTFSGSRTLVRFEELNWLATLESGVAEPLMERSSQQFDNSFLHLSVREVNGTSRPINVLLNDVSGETFGEAVANQSICDRLVCLARCDHLVLMLDGEAIVDRTMRHDHEAKARNFLQRVLQSGQITERTVVHTVISKVDLLIGADDREESLIAAAQVEERIELALRQRVASFHKWRIAARPKDGSLPTVEILSELLRAWVSPVERHILRLTPKNEIGNTHRDFLRFGRSLAD